MMMRKIAVILLLIFILLPVSSLAIEVKNPRSIETEWGAINAEWSKFEYLDGVDEETVSYSFGDYENLKASEISNTEYYNFVNTTYRTLISEASSQVTIKGYIKEYKVSPFTEVDIEANSSRYLLSMNLNLQSLSKGSYILFPRYVKPYYAKHSEEKWESLIKEEYKDIYPADNWILIYDKSKTNTLFITNKRLDECTSRDYGDYWKWYSSWWKFQHIDSEKKYTFKYWLSPIHISENDSTRIIKAKASDLAHEALVKSTKLYQNKTRKYDYWLHEVAYKFEHVKNEWHINPFNTEPHNLNGWKDPYACSATIYLPDNITLVDGPEGHPVVFSSGRNATGLFFDNSVNGPRGNRNITYNNQTIGGGIYLKKFEPKEEVVKVYYTTPAEPITPAEPKVESVPVKIPQGPDIKEIPEYPQETKHRIDAEYIEFAGDQQISHVVLISVASLSIPFTIGQIYISRYPVKREKNGLNLGIGLKLLPIVVIINLYTLSFYHFYLYYLTPFQLYHLSLGILFLCSMTSSINFYRAENVLKFNFALLTSFILILACLVWMLFTPLNEIMNFFPLVAIPLIFILVEGIICIGSKECK